MNESVFVTFNVWDNGKLTKQEVLDVAFDHFMDIQETHDLNVDSCVRQIDRYVQTSGGRKEYVYKFEIRVPSVKRSH